MSTDEGGGGGGGAVPLVKDVLGLLAGQPGLKRPGRTAFARYNTRARRAARGGGGAAEPPAGACSAQGHPRSVALVFSRWLGGVGDPAQSILETGVQIDEQGLGVLI